MNSYWRVVQPYFGWCEIEQKETWCEELHYEGVSLARAFAVRAKLIIKFRKELGYIPGVFIDEVIQGEDAYPEHIRTINYKDPCPHPYRTKASPWSNEPNPSTDEDGCDIEAFKLGDYT
jgi:hypothetical protein